MRCSKSVVHLSSPFSHHGCGLCFFLSFCDCENPTKNLFILLVEKVSRSVVSQIITIVVLLAATGALRFFGISLPYNLQLIPYWTAIILLGQIGRTIKIFDKLSGVAAWVTGIVTSVVSIGCMITGFSMRYDPENVTGEQLAISVVLAVVSIALSILISVCADKIKSKRAIKG